MDALVVGDPADPRTDIGPVIDAEAQARARGARASAWARRPRSCTACRAPAGGHFFAPTLAEIPDAAFLQKEVFGPILHVVRYDPATAGRGRGPARPGRATA